MAKVTTNYPNYSSSKISVGNSSASAGVKNGVLLSDYNMSDAEKSIYDYALSTIANILPQVNTFSPDVQNSMQQSVNAYKNKGIDTINSTYTPMISDLENDIVSRFGNLDNSIFKDDLSSIESKRANAVSSFAQDVLAKQGQLESNELEKRYALINLLNGLADNTFNNALSAINTALGGSSTANNYNNDVYQALNAMSKTNSSNNSNNLSTLLNVIGLTNPSSFLTYL